MTILYRYNTIIRDTMGASFFLFFLLFFGVFGKALCWPSSFVFVLLVAVVHVPVAVVLVLLFQLLLFLLVRVLLFLWFTFFRLGLTLLFWFRWFTFFVFWIAFWCSVFLVDHSLVLVLPFLFPFFLFSYKNIIL